MRQSHIIPNISFGDDDRLDVHVGDGFDATRGQTDLSFRGKLLRMNRDGSAPSDKPHYTVADRGSGGRPDAKDYWCAKGLRNPFGGAWRDANPDATAPGARSSAWSTSASPTSRRRPRWVPGRYRSSSPTGPTSPAPRPTCGISVTAR
jgi:hypothetical protein